MAVTVDDVASLLSDFSLTPRTVLRMGPGGGAAG